MKVQRSVSRKMLKRRRRKGNIPTSSLETKVKAWLEAEKIPFEAQKEIGRIHPDFYFPQTKTAVEISGCYWHCCPQCFPGKEQEHVRQRGKDKRRYTFLYRMGHKVVVIWEHEIEKAWEAVTLILRKASGAYVY